MKRVKGRGKRGRGCGRERSAEKKVRDAESYRGSAGVREVRKWVDREMGEVRGHGHEARTLLNSTRQNPPTIPTYRTIQACIIGQAWDPWQYTIF